MSSALYCSFTEFEDVEGKRPPFPHQKIVYPFREKRI